MLYWTSVKIFGMLTGGILRCFVCRIRCAQIGPVMTPPKLIDPSGNRDRVHVDDESISLVRVTTTIDDFFNRSHQEIPTGLAETRYFTGSLLSDMNLLYCRYEGDSRDVCGRDGWQRENDDMIVMVLRCGDPQVIARTKSYHMVRG